MRTHEWIEERSLALHEAIAAKLEADPGLLSVARANLARWLNREPSSALAEWQRILEITSLPDLLVLLRARTERAVRLRQSSPFPGVLSPPERNRILHAYESRRARAHHSRCLGHLERTRIRRHWRQGSGSQLMTDDDTRAK